MFKSFPKIPAFHNIVKDMRELEVDSPKTFVGTVKLHGTNAAISWYNDTIYTQSRSKIITVDDDNQGFARFVDSLPENVLDTLFTNIEGIMFGEWCGKGIQKGCAIHQLDKMFVIFDIDGHLPDIDHYYEKELELLNQHKIYFITQFPTYEIKIDFNNPEEAAQQLGKLTDEVEAECPVGKYFGISGIGEGIVWKHRSWRFKTKGEKHVDAVSKNRVKVEIDPIVAKSIDDFIELSVTKGRLQQGFDSISDPDMKDIPIFLKWINSDIAEECKDELEVSNLTMRDVAKSINRKALDWYKNELSSFS